MNIGQLISGLVLTIFGVVLIVIALVSGFTEGSFVALIYGIPSLAVGLIILFYRKEDYVEPIKRSIERHRQKANSLVVPYKKISYKGGRKR